MISTEAKPYIDASVPVLREHGLAITRTFYASMFAAHPELRNIFNLGNQASGAQQQSLASAVFAYAANIDNAAALGPVLERIVHKHAAVGVKPGHYTIVGKHLLAAIESVLAEAATPPLLAAWDEAYWLLAAQLIAAEARLYMRAGQAAGELSALTVARVEQEAEDTYSFYLKNATGGSPGAFLPGQYVSVALDFPEESLRQLRQYSLSDAPSQPHWRITVKREKSAAGLPPGRVSTRILDTWKVGSQVPASAAYGSFTLPTTDEGALVFLTAGVGITPVASMLKALADRRSVRPLLHVHVARDGQHAPLSREVRGLRAHLPKLQSQVCFEAPTEQDRAGDDYDTVRPVDLAQVWSDTLAASTFFLCGPEGFMADQWRSLRGQGVDPSQIHRELFGPDALSHLL
jgi:nitric oxide dioxygenase